LRQGGAAIPETMLLASDLDGTLIPAGPTNASADAIARFRRAVTAEHSLYLAYVTGRHLSLAIEGIEEAELPWPHVLVCDVGTTLLRRDGRSWRADESYRALARRAFGDHRAADVAPLLEVFDELELQEGDRQSEFKCSFYFPSQCDAGDIDARVSARLDEAGIPARLVTSREQESRRGLLDVLPRGIAKDSAVSFLANELELGPDEVLFAGDSGNDVDALLAGWCAVLVGNAPEEIREHVRGEAERRGLTERIHLARAPCAAGVLEGCERFGFLR
jgi:sucrose-6F-phosphate phosphohydrolase